MDPNGLRAVIFDMDGVMVDSEPIYFESNRSVFAKLGFTVSRDDYAQFVGLDAGRMWARLKALHDLPHPIPDLVGLEADGMVAGLQAAGLEPMPGLLTLIEALRSRGRRLAVASSSNRRVIQTVLAKLRLENAFDPVVSGEDVQHGKPAPDIFVLASTLLEIPPAECLVIEDSANGVRAAKSAGMRCIGFRNPNSGAQDLSPADAIVNSLDRIEQIFHHREP
jgi:HAD superfamily hydrolase (TIGR01509 family)